jgi:hypothetical protein
MYRHYWVYRPGDTDYRRLWSTILADTRTVIEHTRRAGIVIAGADGLRRPLLDLTEGIALNGDATTDLDGQPFTLQAPPDEDSRRAHVVRGSCATGRKPYDLAVAAVLLRCQHLVPDAFALNSDGGWDTDWLLGPQPRTSLATISPRELVTRLFQYSPPACPFSDITADGAG